MSYDQDFRKTVYDWAVIACHKLEISTNQCRRRMFWALNVADNMTVRSIHDGNEVAFIKDIVHSTRTQDQASFFNIVKRYPAFKIIFYILKYLTIGWMRDN